MINKIYRNLKNGYNYIVTELCKIKINDEWDKLTEKLFKTSEWKKWCKEKGLLDKYPFEDVLA